jgi:hypothetical protein
VTPEAQRIAIAEACGWKNADHPDAMKLKQGWTMPEKWCMDPNGVLQFNHKRPNYLNDLNAMHDAEKVLTNEQDLEYSEALEQVVEGRFVTNNAEDMRRLRSATAAQRAEAFLRTIGKWREAK